MTAEKDDPTIQETHKKRRASAVTTIVIALVATGLLAWGQGMLARMRRLREKRRRQHYRNGQHGLQHDDR